MIFDRIYIIFVSWHTVTNTNIFVALICRHSGLGVKQYQYYDPQTCGFDFKGCIEDIAVSLRMIDFNLQKFYLWFSSPVVSVLITNFCFIENSRKFSGHVTCMCS